MSKLAILLSAIAVTLTGTALALTKKWLFPSMGLPRRTLRLIAIIVCAAAVLCQGRAAYAVEGGAGVYAPGLMGPQAGIMSEPGNSFVYILYVYRGDSTANVSASGQVQVPGTGLELPAQLTGSVETEVESYAHLFIFTHTFKEMVLGGHAALGVLLPYIDTDLNVRGNGVLSLTGPFGNTFNIPLSGEASDGDSDLGDITITPSLGWHDGRLHYKTMLNVYAPTGDYDQNRAVNIGKNHWAIEPMGAVTYMNKETGLELSGAAGITFNFKNSDTDYKSGEEFHLDLAVIQHFSEKFNLGLVGYAYQQLTGDSGGGAAEDYKGRVFGVGPVIGGAIPLGQKNTLFFNARYYYEFDAKNRLEGDTFILTAAVMF